jgi:hypothetical protein
MRCSAPASSISSTRVCSACGRGSTFSVTSRINPERAEAAGNQARHIESGDVLHHLPAEAHHAPLPVHQGDAEHEIAQAAGRHAARPGQPAGQHAANRGVAPKCGGSNASICR